MMEEAWRPGDLVRVLDGPFAELTGTVEEVHAERSRLRVHLSVMGSAYRVELSFDDVEAYDPDNCLTSGARWRRGMAVRVIAGPFRYLVGAIQSADEESQRAIVRLTGLRPEICVEFHYSDIDSA